MCIKTGSLILVAAHQQVCLLNEEHSPVQIRFYDHHTHPCISNQLNDRVREKIQIVIKFQSVPKVL